MAESTSHSGSLYSRLGTTDLEIRLLKLEHNTLHERPCSSIKVTSLKRTPNFAALSYVWGNPTNRKIILLQGQPYSITANLEDALRYLQCIPGLPYLWVDALCINQADPIEKRQQVNLMADIYSAASATYMWIGTPVYFSNVAMDSIRKLQQLSKTQWVNARIYAVKLLIERPYWTRIWVVQEAFYSKHAIVKCGFEEVDFDCFYDLATFIASHNKRPQTDTCPENPDQNLIRFSKFPFGLLFRLCIRDRPKDVPIRIDMFRWLNYTDSFSATLPRDRVFALLNLAFVTDRNNIDVDYTAASDRRIFSKVTAYLMISRSPTQHLLPLQLRQVGKLLNLPSWVPDWTVPPYHDTIITGPKAPVYSAGQDESMWQELCHDVVPLGIDYLKRPVQFGFSEDYETLIVRGIVVDKIAYAFPIADGDSLVRRPDYQNKAWSLTQREILHACRAWEAQAFASPCNAYETIDGLTDAIWRTAMMNKNPDDTSPPNPDYRICYEQWKDAISNGGSTSNTPKLSEYDMQIVPRCELRAFCFTREGRVGLMPSNAREGDLVCIFSDGRVPFVLRAEGDFYTWIGESYIHGIMFGEALRAAKPTDVAVFHVK